MNRSQFEVTPGTRRANRFFWLVGLPTGSCFATWVMVGFGGHHPVTALVVAAFLPLVGLAGVLGYRWLTRDVVRLAAYVPFALGALVFAPATIDLAIDVSRDPDGNFIPVLPFGVGLLLPIVAFACGLSAFTLGARRTRA
jgi:hypothetical protein